MDNVVSKAAILNQQGLVLRQYEHYLSVASNIDKYIDNGNIHAISLFYYIIKYFANKSHNQNLFTLCDKILCFLSDAQKAGIMYDNIDDDMKILIKNTNLFIKIELQKNIDLLYATFPEIFYRNKKKRILIVDDEEISVNVIYDILKQMYDFDIDVASDGISAIENIMNEIESSGTLYDMIIIDIVMPYSDFNGITLLKYIRNIEDYAFNKIIKINNIPSYIYKYTPIIINSDFIGNYVELIRHTHTNDVELLSKDRCNKEHLEKILKKYKLI